MCCMVVLTERSKVQRIACNGQGKASLKQRILRPRHAICKAEQKEHLAGTRNDHHTLVMLNGRKHLDITDCKLGPCMCPLDRGPGRGLALLLWAGP